MFDAFLNGFILVFQWPAIGFVFLGILIGVWLGAVPGLNGIIGLVLLLPFTFEMEPVSERLEIFHRPYYQLYA